MDDASFLHELGTRIRQMRGQHGLSEQTVAEAAEIPLDRLVAFELGAAEPDILEFVRIARVLGTAPAQLIPATA